MPDTDGTIAIISHRGPHNFVWEDNRWVARPGEGGIVAMLEPLARQPNVAWFCCVSEPAGVEGDQAALLTTAADQIDSDLNVVPVPLPAEIYWDYCAAISNEVLWTLQHQVHGHHAWALTARHHRAWACYLEASTRMAAAVAATEIPFRAFLLQDYHLYPLAARLRERCPRIPILHYIHIPFPPPATLRQLPQSWREAMLRGLLGADVVAFQSPADVRSFLRCCEDLLGLGVDFERGLVVQPGHNVRVRAFPASVDTIALREARGGPAMDEARANLAIGPGEQSIVRVDRLHLANNQVLGFQAFSRLLELQPELRGKVRFLAILVPSPTDTTVHHRYRDEVFREVARVNERWRDECGGEPIRVLYTNDRACALAALEQCDVLLANARHDGMKLSVKEWAVLNNRPGALVMSETIGGADEAAGTALFVSPFDVEGTAKALAMALQMPAAEREERLVRLRARVDAWPASEWLAAQLRELSIGLPAETAKYAALHRAPPAPKNRPAGTVERVLTVLNRDGLHARPAAAFVRTAREFRATIEIIREDESHSAQSILAVLTANLHLGAEFTLRATGTDAEEAVERLGKLLEEIRQQEG